MQTHNLKRLHKNKKSRQIGRGGVKAKTAGRGTKGQNARAGHKKRPELRDFIKRIPKLRGRGVNSNKSIKDSHVAVNLTSISEVFANGDKVTPATLIQKGLITLAYGKKPKVKVLSTGEITKKINISGCAVSLSAKTKIETAGGKVLA
ncbi:MAG: uL15 family ribosomal protein [Minisyncoccota bacterium]